MTRPDASTSPVDWSRPIEAVHEDGSVIKAYHTDAMVSGDQSRWVKAAFDDGSTGHWFNPNGNANHIRWRIRNVQPTTPEHDPALWARMVSLIEDVANLAGGATYSHLQTEARAIKAVLKPVDPDLILAREMAKEMAIRSDHRWGKEPYLSKYDSGALDDNEQSGVPLALRGIKRGRELATPEVSHVG